MARAFSPQNTAGPVSRGGALSLIRKSPRPVRPARPPGVARSLYNQVGRGCARADWKRAGALAPGGAERVFMPGEGLGARAITRRFARRESEMGWLSPRKLCVTTTKLRTPSAHGNQGSGAASPHLVLMGLRPGIVALGLPYKAQGGAPGWHGMDRWPRLPLTPAAASRWCRGCQ